VLGWAPEVDFRGLVEMMVDTDVARLRWGITSPVPG
jgi:GDP-D-mannose dehydratase